MGWSRRWAHHTTPPLLLALTLASGWGGAMAQTPGQSLAQQQSQPPAQGSQQALLETRRAQIRQWVQQQQVSLKNQLDCAASARSLNELDRCQRVAPHMGPGMHSSWGTGGWGCPPW